VHLIRDINNLDRKQACPHLRSHLKIIQNQPNGGPQGVVLAGFLAESSFRLAELRLQASARHHLLSKLLIKRYPDARQQRQKAHREALKG
jgi:hypothetical protein